MGGEAATTPEEFLRASLPRLTALARAMSLDVHRAEDLVQTTAEKVLRNWDKVSGADQPHAYVRSMLVRAFIDGTRRRDSRLVLVPDADSGRTSPDPATGVVDRDAFWSAVSALPPRQRAVIVLRYYEDLPDADIADTLGIAQASVRVTAHKALRSLRPVVAELQRAASA